MTTELLDPIKTTELAPSNGAVHQRAEPAVRCTGLEKRFGLIEVVRGVDLEAAQGQLLALLGPSGCGKTTTLRLIAGLETLDAGTVEIAGQVVAGPGR
ncbi:MAG: ATP-binding cassette domain-containing protein, partial [Chloroflexota bacterium]|nr:ATP-binding cassette domain-containing protein [Chloroflexota bacterium]